MDIKKRDFFRNSQKRRQSGRHFQNPYFKQSEQGKRKLPLVHTAAAIGILLILGTAFKLANPRITNIAVDGLESISQEELSRVVFSFLDEPKWIVFSKANRLFFNAEELKTHLEERYAFDALEITTEKRVLVIHATERHSRLLWSSGGEIYLVDMQGIASRSLTEEERSILRGEAGIPPEGPAPENGEPPAPHPLTLLPLFVDLNDAPVNVGGYVLSKEEVENIFLFQNHLRAQQIGFLETRIDRLAGKWMAVRTMNGYDILFDASGDITKQAQNLETLLRETIPPDASLDYIDLRFGDHVYYR